MICYPERAVVSQMQPKGLATLTTGRESVTNVWYRSARWFSKYTRSKVRKKNAALNAHVTMNFFMWMAMTTINGILQRDYPFDHHRHPGRR